jgi:hypothetical protein
VTRGKSDEGRYFESLRNVESLEPTRYEEREKVENSIIRK